MATAPKIATRPGYSDILALGFGTTTAMWALAYILRLPAIQAPAPIVSGGLALLLAVGGYFAGRYSRRGWIGGALTGLLSGALNLLIVLSAVSERFKPGAAEAVNPAQFIGIALATVVASVVICLLGAAVGNTRRARSSELPNWTAVFSKVAVAATLILIVAGGLVTSYRAGLAVPDWPNSFGYNMFLLPLSAMGRPDVFLEHAHRLLGTLVGLTVLTLAIHLSLVPASRWLRLAGWTAFILVCVQGVLGGLRVTETNAAFGAVHGVLAQAIFGLVAGIAVATSSAWLANTTTKRYASAGLDRALPLVLLATLIVQAAIGAQMRHNDDESLLMLHMTVAVIALAIAVFTGVRVWGQHSDVRVLKRRGLGLIHIVGYQLLIGFAAWGMGAPKEVNPNFPQALLSTVHQANGALLLAWTVGVLLWNRKVLLPEAGTERIAA